LVFKLISLSATCSNGTLVVLVSYAGSEQETAAMALDQYGGFGMSTPVPRRIYALVRLNTGVPKYEGGVGNGGMIEGVGDGMKIESVTGVPYATVRTVSSTSVKMQLKRLRVDSRIGTCPSSSGAPWWRCSNSDQVRGCSCFLFAGYVSCIIV